MSKRWDRVSTRSSAPACLHHLADPDLGLRALRDVLDPGGAMQIMVYARYGRTGVYMMQDYCRLLGITTSDQDLDDLSATLGFLPQDHPLTALMHKAKDFRNPDALADAMLHPQDRAYTVPEIHDWLERCGMSFGRWFEQAPYLPQCGAVAKTPHAARLAALPEPAQHAAVELFRGTITQHNFIAYRNDRPVPSQPICFAGDHWRDIRSGPAALDAVRSRPRARRECCGSAESGPQACRIRPAHRRGRGAIFSSRSTVRERSMRSRRRAG